MPQQIDFDPNVDYYKALGVGEKSTGDEIKRAYRKLAKQFHPDSTGGDKAKEQRPYLVRPRDPRHRSNGGDGRW